MEQGVKELIFKVAEKIGSKMERPLTELEDSFELTLFLPNGRKQDLLIFEKLGSQYLRFVSIIRLFAYYQDLKSNLNLETILKLNYRLNNCSLAITEAPSTDGSTNILAFVSVAKQKPETADLVEIEDKVLLAAIIADEVVSVISGEIDNF